MNEAFAPWLRPAAALGSIGCRFGVKSLHWIPDIPLSMPHSTADSMSTLMPLIRLQVYRTAKSCD
jgi:hypothetical protein